MEPLARRAAQEAARPRYEELSARAEVRLARELSRIGAYFSDLEAETARRAARADAGCGKKASLESRKAALSAERAAKTAGARSKHALAVRARFVSLAAVHVPVIAARIELRGRAGSIRLPVAWDAVTRRVEPAGCAQCGAALWALHLCPRCGAGLCPLHRGPCPHPAGGRPEAHWTWSSGT